MKKKAPQSLPKQLSQYFPTIDTKYPMTLKILGLCTVLALLTAMFPDLLEALCFRIIYPWGVITYQFAHVSWMHLISNFLFGLPFMCFLERKIGEQKLLISYLICGIGSAALFGVMQSFDGGLIGASGSISGMAAMACLSFGDTKADKGLGILGCAMMLSVQMAMAVLDAGFSGVAFWGHVGGMLTGIFLILQSK